MLQAGKSTTQLARVRAEIAARLQADRAEIEQAVMARVYGVSEPSEGAEAEYLHGLKAAVSAAVDYALATLEMAEGRSPPVPTALLAQARLAARHGVGLDIVLRRYVSGYMVLTDFALREAEAGVPLYGASLHRLLQAQGTQLDLLLAAVAEEYGREVNGRLLSGEQKRAEWLKRLLAGELLDTSGLGYDFDAWHVGLVLTGSVNGLLQRLAQSLDRRLLRVRPHPGTTWAWLGGQRKIDSAEVAECARGELSPGAVLAVGELGKGLVGWRLSHHQAKAGLGFAQGKEEQIVRYADVGLLASVLKDEVLVNSLRELYLAPLDREPDGGRALREVLHAYLVTDRNVTSAAALLGVSRPTVRTRLRTVEEKIGRTLDACATEVELALKVDRFFRSGQTEASPFPTW